MNFAVIFKNINDKWKSYSKRKKIAVILLSAGILIGISYLVFFLTSTKYDLLFSNMDPADANAIVEKLKGENVPTKISGNSIYVPKEQVDELRMEMLATTTFNGGTNGFELFDSSKFGITDAEMKINYQRALEGELERTIKGFKQIEGARVHLVIPGDSAFVKDEEPAKASVTLSLKTGNSLSPDQVKAITSLISGSVKNLAKENVEVIDNNMNLLTGNTDITATAASNEKQQTSKKTFETDLENSIRSMLETVYGKDKVKVKVFADLNFDSSEKDIIEFAPKGVIKSQQTTLNGSTSAAGTSSSPVDNNMNNTIGTGTVAGNSGTSEQITNYEISKTEEKTIKAPGGINKLSTSVVIDGNIDNNTKLTIDNLVQGAIGYNAARGDSIFIEGLPFNTDAADKAAQDLQQINQDNAKSAQLKLYRTYGLASIGFLLFIILMFILLKKSRKSKDSEKIDEIFNDTEGEKMPVVPKSIVLETKSEDEEIENQIKGYASKKPEQVVDVVKSWLSEDER